MMKLKYTLIIILVSCITYVQAQLKQDIKVPLSDPSQIGYLEIRLHLGGIKVIGTDRKDILVNYDDYDGSRTKSAWECKIEDEMERQAEKIFGKEKKSKKGLKKIGNTKIGLKITQDNNYVDIRNSSNGTSVFITVEVPKNFNLILDTHTDGDIVVQNVNGEIEIESHTANLTCEDISGSINANTYSGEINVNFKNITSNAEMSFSNYSEDIDITFPDGYNCEFKLKTKSEILSDLELQEMTKEQDLKNVGENGTFKIYTNTWTYARLGSGGPEIKVKSEHGDIFLRGQ